MERRNIQVAELPCVENSLQRLELKLKPALVSKLRMLIEGTITFAAPSLGVEDNPLRFLREARIETSDGVLLKALSAVMQAFTQQYEKGTAPLVEGAFVGAIAPGAYNFRFVMEMDFDRETAVTPEATILNSNLISNLFLNANWGTAADFGVGGVLSNLRCRVYSMERDPVNAEDELTERLQNQQTVQRGQFTAANPRLALDLPDNAEIDSIGIIGRDNGALGLFRSDTLINEVRIEVDNGRTVLRRLAWDEIRAQNKEGYNQEALVIGFGLLNFDPEGDMLDMLDLRGRNTPQLVFDVNAPTVPGTAEIEATSRQIITT